MGSEINCEVKETNKKAVAKNVRRIHTVCLSFPLYLLSSSRLSGVVEDFSLFEQKKKLPPKKKFLCEIFEF